MGDYRRFLSEAYTSGTYNGREQLIRTMLLSCRPRYDVSYDYALRMMHTMLRDNKECPAKGMKRRMWQEIKQHVESVIARRQCPIADAVAEVLATKRASRYFLSYKQASKIIYHEQNFSRLARRA